MAVYMSQWNRAIQRQQAGFDPVDAGLWDLENRIYNNPVMI